MTCSAPRASICWNGFELPSAARARVRVGSATRVLECLDFEVELFAKRVAGRLRDHRGYRAIQAVPGVGPTLPAVFVAAIGDVTRFPGPAQLTSWAGLTPKHRESDTTDVRVRSRGRRWIGRWRTARRWCECRNGAARRGGFPAAG